jgi:5'-3' exonuclease
VILSKVLIIDGSNLLYRQLKQSELWELSYNGKRTGAVFGFFRSLPLILQKFPMHYPIIVFDKGRSLRRLTIYPNYKKTEDLKKTNDSGYTTTSVTDEFNNELHRQGDIVLSILEKLKIPTLSLRGYEGDDLIAIISRYTTDKIIVTEDKDMYQLLNEKTKIYRPMRTDEFGNRGLLVTFDKVKHPVYNNARSYVILKSIIGDVSDNIPKVCKGLGEKKAEVICDYILSCNEDPNIYLEIIKSMDAKFFKDFVDNHEQFLLNKSLIDLSLVSYDPLVVEELRLAVNRVRDIPNFIEVVTILGQEGISSVDYQKVINHVLNTRKEVTYD